MTILLRLAAFWLGAVAVGALLRDGVASDELLLRWSATATLVLNVLMCVGLVVGFAIAVAVAAEKGWIPSPLLKRVAAVIRRIGYRVIPPVADRYAEAAAAADLEQLGYPVDEAGFGAVTRGSLQRFQRDHGLPATGWLDPHTIKTLTDAGRARAEMTETGKAVSDPRS
jgi:Putative peptidoglycan binding domain.